MHRVSAVVENKIGIIIIKWETRCVACRDAMHRVSTVVENKIGIIIIKWETQCVAFRDAMHRVSTVVFWATTLLRTAYSQYG
jgi:hypothetical protein